ncbi:N utilization substance protein B [Burkholderia multivorans]|uniref:N utilization substance protein B n=1 Tax=Burkholderia multivorans TaxID=87883 RepID=UPI00338D4B56
MLLIATFELTHHNRNAVPRWSSTKQSNSRRRSAARTAYKYVNGVLDKLARSCGRPETQARPHE